MQRMRYKEGSNHYNKNAAGIKTNCVFFLNSHSKAECEQAAKKWWDTSSTWSLRSFVCTDVEWKTYAEHLGNNIIPILRIS